MTSTSHRLAALWVPFVASTGFAAVFGSHLSGYGLPLSLWLACVLSQWSATFGLFDSLVRSRRTRVYRCRKPDCDFTVRLTGACAAESRRWQETAAAHPHTRL